MCDYSLMHAQSRPAKVGDKLTVRDMGSRTRGLAAAENQSVAVCLLPGTEVAFDKPVEYNERTGIGLWPTEKIVKLKAQTGVFVQVDKENLCTHHDAFEFPGAHDRVLVNQMVEGQTVTVLQLPAAPKTGIEAKAQERLPVTA